MALQGLENFKGIELSEAYLQISNFSYSMNSLLDTSIKTEAVLEADSRGGGERDCVVQCLARARRSLMG